MAKGKSVGKASSKKKAARGSTKKTVRKKTLKGKAASGRPQHAKPAARTVVKKASTRKAGRKKTAVKEAKAKAKVKPARKVVRKTDRKAVKKTVVARPKTFTHKAPAAASGAPALGKNGPLTAKEKRALGRMLNEERERILAFLNSVDEKALNNRHGEGERDRSSYSIHQADFASDHQSLDIALAQRRAEAALLEEIEYALSCLPTKEYGKCRKCKGYIGFQRMLAKPYADYCIECRRQMEPARINGM